jgi:hypothetical protein
VPLGARAVVGVGVDSEQHVPGAEELGRRHRQFDGPGPSQGRWRRLPERIRVNAVLVREPVGPVLSNSAGARSGHADPDLGHRQIRTVPVGPFGYGSLVGVSEARSY